MTEINILTDILGKTIKEISGAEQYSDIISLKFTDGTSADFYHEQSCCEKVQVEEIIGDIEDLIAYPLLVAEEVTNIDNSELLESKRFNVDIDSYTWTFYKFSSIKGSVTIRWLGTSNGCYSERVTFEYSDNKE
jgi:hypothetical protein